MKKKETKQSILKIRISESNKNQIKSKANEANLSLSEYVTRTALSHTLYSSESFQPIITLLYELRSKIARLPIESSINYTDELNELINKIEVK
jgi:hypothetical protein